LGKADPNKMRLRGLDLSKGGENLTYQCNKKNELRELHEHMYSASPATFHVRSARTAAAVGATLTTHAHSFPSRLLLAARRTLSSD